MTGEKGNDDNRHAGGDKGMENDQRTDAVDPHHRRCGIADHRTGAAGIGGGDDTGDIADMDIALEDHQGDGAADQGSGDVIEERGQNGDEHQQHRRSHPAGRQVFRQDLGNTAFLEDLGQNPETKQQTEEVEDDRPFALALVLVHDLVQYRRFADEMLDQIESVIEEQFEQRDNYETGNCHIESLVMEQRHTEQHQGKEHKFHPDAEQGRDIGVDRPAMNGGHGQGWQEYQQQSRQPESHTAF